MLGINACDYFLDIPGRTWEQFLEFFDQLCAEQGTRLWAAAATDPVMLEHAGSMTAEEIAALRETETGEPHYGYTRQVREIRNLADQIITLRAQLGRLTPRDVTFMPRPRMVGDLLNERESELARAELDDLIIAAHANAERLGVY